MPFKLLGVILASSVTIGIPGGRITFPCSRSPGRIAPINGEREDKEAKRRIDFQRPGVVAIAEGIY